MAKTLPPVSGIVGGGDYVYLAMDVYDSGGTRALVIRCQIALPGNTCHENFALLMETINLANRQGDLGVGQVIHGGGLLSVSSDGLGISIGGSHPTLGQESSREESTVKILGAAFPERTVEII